MKIPYYSDLDKSIRKQIGLVAGYVIPILAIALLVFGGLPEWTVQLLGMLLHVYTGIWVFAGILILFVACVFGWISTEDDTIKNIDAFTKMGKTNWVSLLGQIIIVLLVYMGGYYVNGAIMLLSGLAILLGQYMTRSTLHAIMRRKLSTP